MRIGTIIYIPVSTKKAISTKSLNIDYHPIANPHMGNLGPHLFNHTNHLMSNRNTRHSPRYRTMFNMQVTGADTTEGNAHNSIPGSLQSGSGFIQQFKFPAFDIRIGFHNSKDSTNKFNTFPGIKEPSIRFPYSTKVAIC